MIRKRGVRPPPRVRQRSPEDDREETPQSENEEEAGLSLAELIELRKLRKAKQGIDAAKLVKGTAKKRKKIENEEEKGGLRKGATVDDEEDEDDLDAKARRVVRANNFTQQTNALDVDKHMMAYIEENLKVRGRPKDEDEEATNPIDPHDPLSHITERYRITKEAQKNEEGNVTNSMSMLTAIPEVDLGMDARLKNIEETEKAKRAVNEERSDRNGPPRGEEHLVAQRFYRPNLKPKSDADILRDAKLEAMGLPPQDNEPRHSSGDHSQVATDEAVMERFKKRMRK